MKLSDCVSKIVVDKNNPSKHTNNIIKDCKQAQVTQKAWGQTTKRIVIKEKKKSKSRKPRIIESTYFLTRAGYLGLRQCESLHEKNNPWNIKINNPKTLSDKEIVELLNAETNPIAEITSYTIYG